MHLDLSSIQPIGSTDPKLSGWNKLAGVARPPHSTSPASAAAPFEQFLSSDALKAALNDVGAPITSASLALAEALAKLGVPLTEANLLEGQTLLARLPGVSASAFALSKAYELPATPAILQALAAVVSRSSSLNRLDTDTLDVLSLVTQPAADSTNLSARLSRLFESLGRSTENKLLREPNGASTLSFDDSRCALLDLARTPNGGKVAEAADRHASFIEGQQLLNQVTVDKLDRSAPLYFSFPTALQKRQHDCEVQVSTANAGPRPDAADAESSEYLCTAIRINAERLGLIEVSLVGTWTGRLICKIFAAKSSTLRLVRREASKLFEALSALGWQVEPVEVIRREHFPPLWLGGDVLNNPRQRVDQKV